MTTPTTVINIRHAAAEDWDVYIGRACPRAGDPRAHVSSAFRNPYSIDRRRFISREEAVRRYEDYLRLSLSTGDVTIEDLSALKGKRLGCWCKPEPCHGDVLIKLIEEFCP